jgi:hypothetical protein
MMVKQVSTENYCLYDQSFVIWQNTYQKGVDIFRKTFWKIRRDGSLKNHWFLEIFNK